MTAHEYQRTRQQLGTQRAVAARLGVSRVTVAKRETRAMVITREAVLALRALRQEGAR